VFARYIIYAEEVQSTAGGKSAILAAEDVIDLFVDAIYSYC